MLSDDAMDVGRLLTELSTESIKETLEFVAEANLKRIGINDLKVALHDILNAYGCFAKRIDGRILYRAMKHKSGEKTFANVSRIYPDARYLLKLGRANRERQPIFYLSGDPVIALLEVKPKPGDVISVLACKPRSRTSPVLVPIGIDEL